jgi:hypothetical protein
MPEIRVLAVRQPWASLIVEGLKTIEVRSKPTNIRGRVAIYASSKRPTNNDIGWTFLSLSALKMYEEMNESDQKLIDSAYQNCGVQNGYIIGTVEIVDCESIPVDKNRIEKDSFSERRREHFLISQKKFKFYWELSNPVKFSSPIPYTPPKGAVVWSKTELPEEILNA